MSVLDDCEEISPSVEGFCRLVDVLDHIQALVSFASIPVNVFIVFLSIRSIPSCLARTYALNISVTMLVSTLYTFTHVMLKMIFKRALWLDREKTITGLILSMLSNFLSSFTFNVYTLQATLTVILAYLGCSKPMLAKNLTEQKRVFKLFLVGYLIATLLAIWETLDIEQVFGRTFHSVTSIVQGAICLMIILLMALFYIMALINIIKHANNIAVSTTHCKWAVLKSVLIYCTPPNVFLILYIPDIFCLNFVHSVEMADANLRNSCAHITMLTSAFYSSRIFVTSVTALIAFREYRRAVIKMFRPLFRRFRKNSIISVQPSFSADP